MCQWAFLRVKKVKCMYVKSKMYILYLNFTAHTHSQSILKSADENCETITNILVLSFPRRNC